MNRISTSSRCAAVFRRVYRHILVGAATALLASGLLTGPAQAAPGSTAGTSGTSAVPLFVTNVNSDLCLTIAGGSTALNTVAVQYWCDTHPSRRWTLVGFPGGGFYLRNMNSGLCLTIAGGSTALNAVAVQYWCDTHPSRGWRLISNGNGVLFIKNVNSGLCLTIAGGGIDLNVFAVQFWCDAHPSRVWTFPPA